MKGRTIIGKYFNNEKDAVKSANDKEKLWKGGLKFTIIKFNKGYFVVSKKQIK